MNIELREDEKIQAKRAAGIYMVMKKVLGRQEEPDLARERFSSSTRPTMGLISGIFLQRGKETEND
jgi:hypothetical protein